ncbi:unnamed protein product [Rotaria sordida]|uniref:Histidine-specific methyltransferase SAM-dependent domain-containing protein n=1 Tax=Rotaria sordida TaxID=392033 RepID=A0A819EC85_9BILA|nr:unnamed protein product [Rotaria sordida]
MLYRMRINHIDNKLTQIDHDAIVATLRSAIYTQITQLDEYYPSAQELKLLYQRVNDIKSTIIYHSNFENYSSSTIHFIELGCGGGKKVEAWLTPWINSIDDISIVYHPVDISIVYHPVDISIVYHPVDISIVYHPVDISQHAIDSLIQLLKKTFNENIIEQHIKPVCSTFENMYTKINTDIMGIQVVMLMGCIIGNFSSYDQKNIKYSEDAPVMQLLRLIRQNLRIGDWFICTFDLYKNTTTMIRAYNDSKGVTAAFSINLLARLNRELNFNFNLNNYQHYGLFNQLYRQIKSFTMNLQPYDAIQTELSAKYTQDIELLMKNNSMRIIECFITDDHQFPYCLCMVQMI